MRPRRDPRGARLAARIAAGIAAGFLSLSGLGCGDDDEPEGPPPDLESDVRTLSDLITTDPANAALTDIERIVAEDRPVMASEMIESGALPAAQQQVTRVSDAEMATPDGRRLRRQLAEVYELRVAALERWRDALSRGPVEDLELVEAMGAVREADEALLEVDARLQELVPLAPEEGEEDEDERGPEKGAPR